MLRSRLSILMITLFISATSAQAQQDGLDYQKYLDIYQDAKKVSDGKRSTANRDRNQYERKVSDRKGAQSTLRSLKIEKQNNIDEIDGNRRLSSQLSDEIDDHESRIDSLNRKLRGLKDDLSSEDASLERKDSEIAGQNKRVERSGDELRNAQQQLDSEAQLRDSVIRDLNDAQAQRRATEARLAELKKNMQLTIDRTQQLEKINQDLARQDSELTEKNRELRKLIRDLQLEIDDLNRRKGTIEDDVFALKKVIIDNETEVQNLGSNVEAQEKKVAQITTSLKELNAKAAELKAEIDRLKTELDALENKIQNNSTKLADLKSKSEALQAKIDASEDEDEIKKLKKERRTILAQIKEIQPILSADRTAKKEKLERRKQASSERQEIMPKLQNLRADLETAKRELGILQNKFTVAAEQLASRNKRLKRDEQKLARLMNQVMEKRKSSKESRDLITSNDETISGNQVRTEKNNETLVKIRKKRKDLQGQTNLVVKELQQLDQQINLIQGKVDDCERAVRAAVAKKKLAEESLNGERSKLSRMNNERQQILQVQQNLRSDISSTNGAIATQKGTIASKSDRISQLKSSNERLTSRNVQVSTSILDTEQSIASLLTQENALLAKWEKSNDAALKVEAITATKKRKYNEIRTAFDNVLSKALREAREFATKASSREATERSSKTARIDALRVGKVNGTRDGTAAAEKVQYQKSYDSAYPVGIQDGTREGDANGKKDGYAKGYEVGKKRGLAEGLENGRKDGYKEGYDENFGIHDNDDNEQKGFAAGEIRGTNDAVNQANRTQTPEGMEDELARITSVVAGDRADQLNQVELDQSDLEVEEFEDLKEFPTTVEKGMGQVSFIDAAAREAMSYTENRAFVLTSMVQQSSIRIGGHSTEIPDPLYTYNTSRPNYGHPEIDTRYNTQARNTYKSVFPGVYESEYKRVYGDVYKAQYKKSYDEFYAKDYPQSKAKGKKDGHRAGYNKAYQPTYNKSYAAADRNGQKQGRLDHLKTRYDEGHAIGRSAGLVDGQKEGASVAYKRGFADGKKTGFDNRISSAESEAFQAGREKLRAQLATSSLVKIVSADFENESFKAGESVNMTIVVRNFGGAASKRGEITMNVAAKNNRLYMTNSKVMLKPIPAFSEATIVHTIDASAVAGAKGYDWYKPKVNLSIVQNGKQTSDVTVSSDKDVEYLVQYKSKRRGIPSVPQGGNSWQNIFATFVNVTGNRLQGYEYKMETVGKVTRTWKGNSNNGWRKMPTLFPNQETQIKELVQRIPGVMPNRSELEADGWTWKKHIMKFQVRDSKGKIVFDALYYIPVKFY